MDDNAIPHRGRTVITHLRNNAIETLPLPAKSPDLNPIEHLWDYPGSGSSMRNLQEQEQELHEKWQRIPMERIRRLVVSMGRRLAYVIRARGGYYRYWFICNRLIKHVYSWFKSMQTSNLDVWPFLTILLWMPRTPLLEYLGNIANKVSSKLKLPFSFVSITSTHVDSHLVKTI